MRASPTVLLSLLLLSGATQLRAQSCPQNPQGGPNSVTFTVGAAGSDLDLGVEGDDYHNFKVSRASSMTLCLSDCDLGSDPECTATGGTVSVDGVAFGPPIPLIAGSFPVCLPVKFTAAPAGTADIQTGDVTVTVGLSAQAFLSGASEICPRCSGTNLGDAGTCSSGARTGLACTTEDIVTVAGGTGDTTYRLSRDCLPAGAPAGAVAFTSTLGTGTSSLNGSRPCPGQTKDDDCSAPGTCTGTCNASANQGGVPEFCCSNRLSRPCFPTGSGVGRIERTGTAAGPAPAWPNASYPKNGNETLAGVFCAPRTNNFIVDPSVGLPGPVAIVLPVSTVWGGNPTPPPTTTSTTILVPTTTSTSTTSVTVVTTSTTSTTAPTCNPADCDDDDPCTDDTCAGAQCSRTLKPGAAGVSCRLGQLVGAPLCGDDPVDPALRTFIDARIGKARASLDKIVSGSKAKVIARLRRAAIAALTPIAKRTGKSGKTGKITSACATAIKATIKNAQQTIKGFQP